MSYTYDPVAHIRREYARQQAIRLLDGLAKLRVGESTNNWMTLEIEKIVSDYSGAMETLVRHYEKLVIDGIYHRAAPVIFTLPSDPHV